MATKEAVIKELAKLEAVLQDKKLGDLTLVLYQKPLLHFPEEVLAQAVAELIKTCRYFPTIAEILAVADPILQQYNLKKLKQIEEDRLNECRKFVYYAFATNRVYCRAQPEDSCECAMTGDRSKCRMWELLDELRRKDWIENNRTAGQAPAGAPEQQEGSHDDQR